ncbi:hypothetical protein C8J57DRAFT_1569605 [Mycena rebaudengoi]|nr:hypothetical protein C8J57DRAFT_1569605 [Mycena rebaudengoi]
MLFITLFPTSTIAETSRPPAPRRPPPRPITFYYLILVLIDKLYSKLCASPPFLWIKHPLTALPPRIVHIRPPLSYSHPQYNLNHPTLPSPSSFSPVRSKLRPLRAFCSRPPFCSLSVLLAWPYPIPTQRRPRTCPLNVFQLEIRPKLPFPSRHLRTNGALQFSVNRILPPPSFAVGESPYIPSPSQALAPRSYWLPNGSFVLVSASLRVPPHWRVPIASPTPYPHFTTSKTVVHLWSHDIGCLGAFV